MVERLRQSFTFSNLNDLSGNQHRSILADFLAIQNNIRTIDGRVLLEPEEIAAIPKDAELISALLNLFANPLQFAPEQWPNQFKLQKSVDDTNSLQVYLRRLTFPDHSNLAAFLENLTCSTGKVSHYSERSISIITASKALPIGPRSLFYGDCTVAGGPIDEWEEDSDEEDWPWEEKGAFFIEAVKVYDGKVDVFEVVSLTFEVGTAKPAIECRADIRTELFECLVVDSFGFAGLNTAPPGRVLRYEKDKDIRDMILAVQAY